MLNKLQNSRYLKSRKRKMGQGREKKNHSGFNGVNFYDLKNMSCVCVVGVKGTHRNLAERNNLRFSKYLFLQIFMW